MSRFHSVRLASLAALAGCTSVSISSAAPNLAPARLRWSGTVTCKLTINGPHQYSDTQNHKWEIPKDVIPKESTQKVEYPADWTVTGSGQTGTGISWTTDGHKRATIGFTKLANGDLLIGLTSSRLVDPIGLTLTGASLPYFSIFELQWQSITLSAKDDQTSVRHHPPATMPQGAFGYQQPGMANTPGTNVTATNDCSWSLDNLPTEVFPPYRRR